MLLYANYTSKKMKKNLDQKWPLGLEESNPYASPGKNKTKNSTILLFCGFSQGNFA